MADNTNDPFGFNRLNDQFNRVVAEIENGVDSALGALHDLIDSASSDDFDVIHDAMFAIFQNTQNNAELTAAFFNEAFASWVETFGSNADAIADMVRRLFEQFSHLARFFRTAMAAFVRLFDDFPKFFARLAKSFLAQTAEISTQIAAFLLGVLAAGVAVFGADKAAEALWRLMGDADPFLATPITAFDIGVSPQNLGALSLDALGSANLTLPVGVWLAAAMIDALRQAGDFAELMAGAPTGNAVLDEVLSPVTAHFGQIATDYIEDVEDLTEALVQRLVMQADNDAALEWLLLKLARFTPVGVLILVIATAVKLVTSPAPWLNLLLNPIEEDPTLSVMRLPRPTRTRKYVVFSDVHRDEKDSARPPFQFGSIDHFLRNQDMYLDLLKHHQKDGYVIIEAGDCEELWFHRDFSVTPAEKLRQIIDTNREIYDLQRQLHREGRYFRVYGNHDSYLRDPDTFDVLRTVMEEDGGPEFRIHDFIIIESVKTMHDVPFYLSLDSAPNRTRKPLIVTHGHQWDFWNCDSNNILGKIIVSAVVTPLDMLDDPFRDIGGISSYGTPLTNFRQIISDLPVFNSWQSYEPGVQKLDHIQHMADNERVFTDDIQYSETMASLLGMLIPVAHNPGDDSFASLDGMHYLFNLMSIGHTHNPHNMPYYDLGDLPFLKPMVDGLEAQIAAASAGMFNPQVGLIRSNYINTGVCGWYHDCVWALDLGDQSHGTGQPKLVNWTYNTRLDRPNHMDWELPHIPDNGSVTPGDVVDARLGDLLQAGRAMIEAGKGRALDTIASLPISDVMQAAEATWKARNLIVSFDKGRAGSDALMLQLAMALMPGTRGDFEATLQLPKPLKAELSRLMKLRQPGAATSERRKLCAAIATLAVSQGMARYGLRGQPASDAASATGLLVLLMQLVETKRDDFRAELQSENGALKLRVEYSYRAEPDKPVRAVARRDNAQTRGVTLRAHLQDSATPLSGWTVRLERRSGRKTTVLASARTDAKGHATLLGADRTDPVRLRSGTSLSVGLYPPKTPASGAKAVKRFDLQLPRDTRAPISLPVSYAELRRAGVYKGSKIRPPDRKLNALCDGWKKRLSDPRDPHAKDELCLQDLVLSTIGALDAPKTAFEKRAAKAVKQHLKDTDALPEVAKLAQTARDRLKDCLGSGYVACDGSGSFKDLGKRLLNDDLRFENLVKFFGNPTPDPLLGFPSPQPGTGLPSAGLEFDKICQDRAETGDLDPAVAAQMADLATTGILAQPRINLVNIWDPGLGAGEIGRIGDITEKVLTLRSLQISGETADITEKDLNMDVELDDPACVVLMADASNRQIMATDVKPGQSVVLYGSGLVSAEAAISASFQAWEVETSNGRLVPDDTVLPAGGFADLVVPVFGRQLPVEEGSTPTTYNGDTIGFRWPDAAGQPGLYRIRVTCRNESDYPTSVTQNADCTLVVGRADVSTQDVYFVVLPAASAPPVRAVLQDVICDDLTDPENILGIPWPDDLLLLGTVAQFRINIPTDGSDPTEEILSTFLREDSLLLFGPGTWTPAMRLFPENAPFDQIGLFDSVFAQVDLLEIEGVFDSVVVGVIAAVAVIVIAMIVAAIIIAVILAFAEPTPLAEIALAALLSFVFGAAFSSLSGAVGAIATSLNGSDRILSGAVTLSGHALMFDQAPVRFHRVLSARADLQEGVPPLPDLDDTFENDVLGGSYRVQVRVETDT